MRKLGRPLSGGKSAGCQAADMPGLPRRILRTRDAALPSPGASARAARYVSPYAAPAAQRAANGRAPAAAHCEIANAGTQATSEAAPITASCPHGSSSRQLVASSRFYGLTTGGINSEQFGLADLGEKAASDDETERLAAFKQAVMNVPPFETFFTRNVTPLSDPHATPCAPVQMRRLP